MKQLFRLIKRKRNVRRLLAAMFLVVFAVELASHVLIDAQDPNALTMSEACSINENVPARADCPEQRRQQQEQKNLLDEMTTHMVVLNTMVIPHSGIMYRTGDNYASQTRVATRTLTPPSQPPKQA